MRLEVQSDMSREYEARMRDAAAQVTAGTGTVVVVVVAAAAAAAVAAAAAAVVAYVS